MANSFGEGFLIGQQIRRNRESARERFRQRELQKQAEAFLKDLSEQIGVIHAKYAVPQQELNNLMLEAYMKPVADVDTEGLKQLRARKRLLDENLLNEKMAILGPARLSELPGVGERVGMTIDKMFERASAEISATARATTEFIKTEQVERGLATDERREDTLAAKQRAEQAHFERADANEAARVLVLKRNQDLDDILAGIGITDPWEGLSDKERALAEQAESDWKLVKERGLQDTPEGKRIQEKYLEAKGMRIKGLISGARAELERDPNAKTGLLAQTKIGPLLPALQNALSAFESWADIPDAGGGKRVGPGDLSGARENLERIMEYGRGVKERFMHEPHPTNKRPEEEAK